MANFCNLPLELGRFIAEDVAIDRPSLESLALASKPCYEYATPFLFRNLRVSVHSPEEINATSRRLYQTLDRSDSFDFIQSLTITIGREVKEPDYCCLLDDRNDDDMKQICALDCMDDSDSAKLLKRRDLVDHTLWDNLGNILSRAKSISTLIYSCSSAPFPSAFLRILDQRKADCKLYINSLGLPKNATNPRLSDVQVDLITSRHLQGICIQESSVLKYGNDGEAIYNTEGVQQILNQGLAKNIQKVAVVVESATTTNIIGLLGHAPPPFEGLELPDEWHTLEEKAKMKKSSITFFCLSSQNTLRLPELDIWFSCMDFSLLRVLKLEQRVEQNGLIYLARKCPFPKLESLSIVVLGRFGLRGLRREYIDAVAEFISAQPPLLALGIPDAAELELEGLLESVLQIHGNTLRSLWIGGSSAFPGTLEDVVAKLCPNLEKLGVQVRRSLGNKDEVIMYRAIGSIRTLHEVSLVLDCFSHNVIGVRGGYVTMDGIGFAEDEADRSFNLVDRPFDEFEMEYVNPAVGDIRYLQKGHVTHAFINCAVDGALAKSIFETISSAQGEPHLRKLTIETISAGYFRSKTQILSILANSMAQLSRRWTVGYSIRDDQPGQLVAHERPAYDTPNPYPHLLPEASDELGEYIEPIFRRLWPGSSSGDSDWRSDWHSFPLDLAAADEFMGDTEQDELMD